MLRYVAGRVAQAVGVLWAAYTTTFFILYLLPSDPIALRLAGGNLQVAQLTPQELHALEVEYGLDKSPWEQYTDLVWRALHLDLGQSSSLNLPVSTVLAQRLPPTLTLGAFAVLLMLLFGVTLAYLAVYVQWRPLRTVLTRLPSLGVSLPSFWVGLLLVQVFSFSLHWFPSTGAGGVGSYVLPAITMALPASALLAQVLIRSLEQTMDEPYVTTAQAIGLSRAAVQFRHAFRNAVLPALTLLGLLIGYVLTNAVVAETVFSISGIGRLAQQAVLAQDVAVVQGIVLFAAGAFVLVNLVVDLLYPLLDPRIAHTAKAV